MNCLRVCLQVPIAFSRVIGTALTRCCASLYSLFQRALHPVHDVPLSPPLLHRNIHVGGVENSGNSCILSVLLQEMAALPNFYDLYLNTPLKCGENESQMHFSNRKRLQTLFRECVNEIRGGNLVKKDQIGQISKVLLELGWQKESTYLWRRLLHKYAPATFPLPTSSPHNVYNLIFSLFPEISFSSEKIFLLSRISSVSNRQLFENEEMIQKEKTSSLLLRVAEDFENPDSTGFLENFQIKERSFSLQLIHVMKSTPKGNHVFVYRKENNKWICCNDDLVTNEEILPTKNIYMVVYESRLLGK